LAAQYFVLYSLTYTLFDRGEGRIYSLLPTPTPYDEFHPKPKIKIKNGCAWLDVLAITAWGILMLKYWLTGKLNLLIHLIIFSDCRVGLADCRWLKMGAPAASLCHSALAHNISPYFPGFSSTLLLAAAILGLSHPVSFASQTNSAA